MSPKIKILLLIAFTSLTSVFITLIFSRPSSEPQSQNPLQSSPQVKAQKQQAIEKTSELIKVTKVIDGDTIEIEGGQRVRYIGIDTPEISHPQKPVECFAKEAKIKNEERVEGKFVRLEKDVSETDKYGRLLRYVYVDEIFVNDYLVKEGFAYASSYPPDVKYQDQFIESQAEAEKENRGLWANCGASSSNSSLSKSEEPQRESGCEIKGNISSGGEKIYHIPGQRYYNKTVIDEDKGEKWFCTQEEAEEAGWRKSKI